MAATRISAAKIAAYEATHYGVGSGSEAFTLHIGQPSPQLASLYAATSTDCALFITAWNPYGEERAFAENEAAHQRLGTALHSLSTHVIEGAGADPTGAWPPEQSFLALGIDAEGARRLGTDFEQDAVVWAGPDAVPGLLLLR
jgi:hypothetical protein